MSIWFKILDFDFRNCNKMKRKVKKNNSEVDGEEEDPVEEPAEDCDSTAMPDGNVGDDVDGDEVAEVENEADDEHSSQGAEAVDGEEQIHRGEGESDKCNDESVEEENEEIEGVLENPLFEPAQETEPAPIESFSMDALGEEDLDFEPDIEESATAANKETTIDNSNWMENITSPGKVTDGDGIKDTIETMETIDEVRHVSDIDVLNGEYNIQRRLPTLQAAFWWQN